MIKAHAHWRSLLAILSIIFLLSSCASERTEQRENGAAQYIAIPVSSTFDMELLLDRRGPWVATEYVTGESRGIWADNVFQADDGSGMIFATVPFGSGIISTSIQGYDPASGKMYVLDERGRYDYRFFMYENELFVVGRPMMSNMLVGIFRPVLDHEALSFDLVEVDDELSSLIQHQWQ